MAFRSTEHRPANHQGRTLEDELSGPMPTHRRIRARCWCGWLSASTSTAERAEARWRIHVRERRSAAWIDQAVEQQAQLRRRNDELLIAREAARRRRRALRAQRMRTRDLLQRARGVDERAAPPHLGSLLDNARDVLGWSVGELWWAYFELGGRRTEDEVAAMLADREPMEPADRAVLVTALNEQFAALGHGHPLPMQVREP
jgi:hypothetical protein